MKLSARGYAGLALSALELNICSLHEMPIINGNRRQISRARQAKFENEQHQTKIEKKVQYSSLPWPSPSLTPLDVLEDSQRSLGSIWPQ